MNLDVEKAREAFEALHQKWRALKRKLNILLIEDQPEDAFLIRNVMAAYPTTIVTVPSGESALATMNAGEFDLVVLDLKLVGMQGVDVLRAATALGIASPIIVLTGLDYESDDIKEALALGAKLVISKPLSPSDVDFLLAGLRAKPQPLEANEP